MPLARNSAPYAFRSFGRIAPTAEQLRQELESSFEYTKGRLDDLEFGTIRGTIVERQAPFVTSSLTVLRTEQTDADSALTERIDELSATIVDPRTGLAQAHARITLAQRVQVTANSALASQVSTVLAQVGNAQASVTEERIARVSADGVATASLSAEVSARTSGDSALSANITAEQSARVSADGVIARNIVSTSAIAGISGVISVQTTAPVSPSVGNYWVNNTNPADLYTYRWNGSSWVQVTNPISIAAVSVEATARLTADGYLSGNYSLQVLGSGGGLTVVTGMNITSSISSSGGTVSSVVFRASDFQIWNSTPDTGVAMFDISGSTIRLAGTLVVSTSGKVYIGTGTFNNTNTAFYVDSTGQFSLKDKLSWDLTTLSISGSITSTSGTIGGFTLGANTLTAGAGATYIQLSATGSITVGTSGLGTSIDPAQIAIANSSSVTTWRVLDLGTSTVMEMWNSAGVSKISLTGNTGAIVALTFAGSGASLTSLNASNVSSGTLVNARLPSTMQLGNGTAGAPTFSFNSVTTTGVYLSGAGDLSFTTIGTRRGYFDSVGDFYALHALRVTGSAILNSGFSATGSCSIIGGTLAVVGVLIGDGTLAAPGLRFDSDSDTGLRLVTAGNVDFVCGGVARMALSASYMQLAVPLRLDNTKVPGAPVAGGTVTIIDSAGATIQVLVV